MQQSVDFPNNVDGTTVLKPNEDEFYVIEMIESMAPTNVKQLGMRLGLGFAKLQAMQQEDIHGQMAHAWLQSSNNPTWRALATALKEMNCQYVINLISECHSQPNFQQQQQDGSAGVTPPTDYPSQLQGQEAIYYQQQQGATAFNPDHSPGNVMQPPPSPLQQHQQQNPSNSATQAVATAATAAATGPAGNTSQLSSIHKYCKPINLLSQEDREDFQYQLDTNLKKILGYFDDYTSALQEILEEKSTEATVLSEYLSGLHSLRHSKELPLLPSSIREELGKATTIGKIFLILKTECTSFLDCYIFERLMKRFKITAEQDERLDYPSKLAAFITDHRISEFIELQPILGELTDKKKLVLVLNIDSMSKLARLGDIKKAVSEIIGLKPSALLIHDIKEKCVIVTFLISTPVAEFIFTGDNIFSQEQREKFRSLLVVRLECNGYTYLFDKKCSLTKPAEIQTAMSEAYQEYVSHFQLRPEQLGARVSDKHILELADMIIHWEEDLVWPLELTREEINNIRGKIRSPRLERTKVLQIWQDKKRPHDTYGLLLQKLLEGKHADAAETLCVLLQKKQAPSGSMPRGAAGICTVPTGTRPAELLPIPDQSRTVVESRHYGILCEQLRRCATKWRIIAAGLSFHDYEIETIASDLTKLVGSPESYMDAVLSEWLNWGPGDERGSEDVATLEALKEVLNRVGYGRVAGTLKLSS